MSVQYIYIVQERITTDSINSSLPWPGAASGRAAEVRYAYHVCRVILYQGATMQRWINIEAETSWRASRSCRDQMLRV